MRTIAEMLRWRARRHPSLEAVWFDGKSQTFAELDESSSQLAAGLIEKLGLKPGDRVSILDKNSAAYLELFFALDKAGLVAAPINWRLTPHEVKQIIDDIKPKLIVTGPEFKAPGAAAGVPTMTFDDLPRGGTDPMRDVDGAVSCQVCTSGTTGLPKGAMLTGWNLLNVGSCGALENNEMREGGRSLVCLPLFHIGGTILSDLGAANGIDRRHRARPRAGSAAHDHGGAADRERSPGADADVAHDRAAWRAPPTFPRSSSSAMARRRSRPICCAARSRLSNAASCRFTA